ncbi:hypothetical protein GLOIN_2v1518502 [Rhizophagus irregularis DAOM 181602=DAOM 197198]|uniref:Uncharacterized protein n=1 Tax=Rhizophagus irregularis (strain DAOM 181602 / DAOM 197198 / MUCL 43194) TaxID=747089 RepID=A0A2P4QS18_RHIID|nr:hypothetical protein GLOIN_2v1518502 [Rhizophagus irregularis DAOM 181602=DAOM 197198]POG80441.1 hypothetical protein GLOIN_2v1518502 [Rhizophagus irregularis DAOM 181602=DAOM 197198]|eukprot:XP_025187307.1 hypothetical protein GLOIN_2v1518502 [Rhizophagus irregularis DAOM 181602=DAOM 197198]
MYVYCIHRWITKFKRQREPPLHVERSVLVYGTRSFLRSDKRYICRTAFIMVEIHSLNQL